MQTRSKILTELIDIPGYVTKMSVSTNRKTGTTVFTMSSSVEQRTRKRVPGVIPFYAEWKAVIASGLLKRKCDTCQAEYTVTNAYTKLICPDCDDPKHQRHMRIKAEKAKLNLDPESRVVSNRQLLAMKRYLEETRRQKLHKKEQR